MDRAIVGLEDERMKMKENIFLHVLEMQSNISLANTELREHAHCRQGSPMDTGRIRAEKGFTSFICKVPFSSIQNQASKMSTD